MAIRSYSAWVFAFAFMMSAVQAAPAVAAPPEQPNVTVAVGGLASQIDKLAYAVALNKGYFKEEGLTVESLDFNSGSKGLEAMVGGSADVTLGAYNHAPELQVKHVDLIMFALFNRYPGNVLVIAKGHEKDILTPADLKGKMIGISAPGSATQGFFGLVMQKVGMGLDCCTYVSVGTGATAVAAMHAGSVDALVSLDPIITEITNKGYGVVMADSRTEQGTRDYYGGPDMIAGLYAKTSWVKANPNTVQAMANAIAHATQFMRTHTPAEIADSVPKSYYGGDRERYIQVVTAALPAFLWDDMGTPEAAENAVKELRLLTPALRTIKFDLPKTYTNEFMARANQLYH
jgi:NitT/TauT family transport system substrate-binding protein